MQENEKMKKHLINLLYEEYKQDCIFDELYKKGINMLSLAVDNRSIVYDIIGFPKERSLNDSRNILIGNPGLELDEIASCREAFDNKYIDIFDSKDIIKTIEVIDWGLVVTDEEKAQVKDKLKNFVEWLYVEFEKLK